jgi:hypothetical protein
MILGLSPFGSIATAELGEWLHGVLSALLDAPGDLYNPVYVGPLPVEGSLRDLVGAAAGRAGLEVLESPAVPIPGVWVSGIEEAEAALAAGVTPRPGVQWVVWSAVASAALPDRLAGWLGSTGLAIDPLAGAADRVGGWSMQPLVQEVVGSQRGGGPRFVVVVGESHDLGSLAAELQLHLELELEAPVWRGAVDGWFPGDESRSVRVLVVTRGTDLGALCQRLAAVPAGSGPWGLVLDSVTADRLGSVAGWEALSARSAWIGRNTVRPPVDEGVFPPVCELLVATPTLHAPDGIAQFDLDAVSLPEILQSAEGWARSGTLVVFALDRAAYVVIGRGRVGGAGFYGSDRVAGEDEPDVHDVLCSLTSWSGAVGVFVPGEVEGGGVPIGRLVMSVAHATSRTGAFPSPPRLRPHEVAKALLAWGLMDTAAAFLRRAEMASPWGPEEDVLLGSISAVNEPEAGSARLRHGAMRAFSERGPDGGTELYVNGMLNALLVEVRGGQTLPAVAWSIVGGWLRDVGAAWATTARHAAIWMELALRAGARDSAADAQDRLRAFPDSSDRWGSLLRVPLGSEDGND